MNFKYTHLLNQTILVKTFRISQSFSKFNNSNIVLQSNYTNIIFVSKQIN